MKLGASSLRVLAAILWECQQGRNPSIYDLMTLMGWYSPHAVHRHVLKLDRAGLVTWKRGHNRTLRPRCRMFLFE